MIRKVGIFLAVVVVGLFLLSVQGCGDISKWWGGLMGGGQPGQDVVAPGGEVPPAPAAEGEGPAAGGEAAPAGDEGAGPVAGGEVAPAGDEGAGPVAGGEVAPAGDEGGEPVAGDGGAVPAAEALPELQVEGFVFFPDGSNEPAGHVRANTKGKLLVKLVNAGNAPANGVECYVQLDNRAKDFFILERIPASGNVMVNRQLKLDVPPGEHLIKCIINEGKAIKESDRDNERNNEFRGIIDVLAGEQPPQDRLPELQVMNLFVAREYLGAALQQVNAGDKVWLNTSIKNAGLADPGVATGQFQVDNNPPQVFRLGGLLPGRNIPCGMEYVFDKPGKCTLKSRINTDNAVRESDSADDRNNEMSIVVDVLPAQQPQGNLPDLCVKDITFVPYDPVAGREIATGPVDRVPADSIVDLKGRVENIGAGNAALTFAGFQVDNDNTDWAQVPPLRTGTGTNAFRRWKAAGVGKHTVRLMVNQSREVIESDAANDTNNTVTREIEVYDASAASAGSGAQALEGTIDIVAIDIGFMPAGISDYADQVYAGTKGSITGFFRSNSAKELKDVETIIEMDGRVLKRYKKNIQPGVLMSYNIPDQWFTATGRYKLTIKVDPDNKIKELDESNNTRSCYVNVIARRTTGSGTSSGVNTAIVSSILGGIHGSAVSKPSSGSLTATPVSVSPSSGYQTTPPPAPTTTSGGSGTSVGSSTKTYTPGKVKLFNK